MSSPTTTADVDARLRKLEDLEEIRQLFVDYGYYLDHGDFSAYAQLFADDGEVLLGPMGRAKGREAIQAIMEKTLGGRTGTSFHIISNPIIHLAGDEATTDVAWSVVVRQPDGQPRLTMFGRHRDIVVRERGQWKFKRRAGYVDIPAPGIADLPGKAKES